MAGLLRITCTYITTRTPIKEVSVIVDTSGLSVIERISLCTYEVQYPESVLLRFSRKGTLRLNHLRITEGNIAGLCSKAINITLLLHDLVQESSRSLVRTNTSDYTGRFFSFYEMVGWEALSSVILARELHFTFKSSSHHHPYPRQFYLRLRGWLNVWLADYVIRGVLN